MFIVLYNLVIFVKERDLVVVLLKVLQEQFTSVYQLVFRTRTKYAGLSYLGLDQLDTAQKLLEGVLFRPFIIELENISIFVGCLGKIIRSNTNKIGQHFSASLFYKYKK